MSPQANVAAGTALVALLTGAFGVLSALLPPPAPRPQTAVLTSAPPPPDFIVPVARVAPDDLVNTWGAARDGGRKHAGIDIMAPAGRAVHAAADGVVARMTTNELGGIVLYQRDADGGLILYYAHLQRYAPGLKEGDAIVQGQTIGYVGATGNATTPHLHFEIMRQPYAKRWWGGKSLNPYPVLKTGALSPPRPTHAEAGAPAAPGGR